MDGVQQALRTAVLAQHTSRNTVQPPPHWSRTAQSPHNAELDCSVTQQLEDTQLCSEASFQTQGMSVTEKPLQTYCGLGKELLEVLSRALAVVRTPILSAHLLQPSRCLPIQPGSQL